MPTLRHFTLTLLLVILPISTQANEATWQALKEGGLVILMRHSLALVLAIRRVFWWSSAIPSAIFLRVAAPR